MAAEVKNFWLGVVGGVIGGVVVTLLMLRIVDRTPTSPGTTNSLSTSGQSTTVLIDRASSDDTIVQVVEKTSPAVVSVVITKDVPVVERYFESIPGPNFSPFGGIFDQLPFPFQFQVPRLRQRGTQPQEIGGGSGFLVSADGLIITNRHVVSEPGAQYTVFLNDGTKQDATVVAVDPLNDVAVIKIDGQDLPFLQFGDSDNLKVGQTVIAIGNALGEFRNTVSVGVISGLSRSITAGDAQGQSEQLEQVIQTDAAINPGNSGGPLLDLNGNVIGVNVAVAVGSENIGFALPGNIVRSVVESVQATGRIVRPYLGVRYIQITPALQEAHNLPVDSGVLLSSGVGPEEAAVVPGSPADRAGLRDGDIILEIDGAKIDQDTTLAAAIRQKTVGDTVRLKVLRRGSERDMTIQLAEFPQ